MFLIGGRRRGASEPMALALASSPQDIGKGRATIVNEKTAAIHTASAATAAHRRECLPGVGAIAALTAEFHPNLGPNERTPRRTRAFSVRYSFRFVKPSAFVIPSAFAGLSVHAAPVNPVRRCASPVAFLFSDPLDRFIGILLPIRFGPAPTGNVPRARETIPPHGASRRYASPVLSITGDPRHLVSTLFFFHGLFRVRTPCRTSAKARASTPAAAA